MSIQFAAVHEKNTWRRHSGHQTLEAAISGRDGAENLLRGFERVGRDMHKAYGVVHAVFVWDDTEQMADALRLAPGSSHDIERVKVRVELVELFQVRHGPSLAQIDEWFRSSSPDVGTLYPDDIPGGVQYFEGAVAQVLVNVYERNAAARRACINHYGYACMVCDLDFEVRYGSIGRSFIHVHHEVPIADIGANYQVDPIRDLKPVCPNCHAMLHRQDPPLPIEKLRAMLCR
nr:HNH endonuclease [Burkholderia ambifaria]